MENTEVLLNKDSSRFDTRKVLNRAADVRISQAFLDALHKEGLTSEALDGFKYPVFRYTTQITLHGVFPDVEIKRIGGYKSAFLNDNGTLGVRYNAIDYGKKKEIGDYLSAVGWSYQRDSTGDAYYFNARDERKVREIYDRINVAPFYATKRMAVARFLGIYYVIVYVRAVYAEDVWPIIRELSGMEQGDVEEKYRIAKEAYARRRQELNEQMDESERKREATKEESLQRIETEFMPQIDRLPFWNGEFVADTMLVGINLSYSELPSFHLYKLVKAGGYYQYQKKRVASLTEEFGKSYNRDDKHSERTPALLLKSMAGLSLKPLRVLSQPDVAPARPVYQAPPAAGQAVGSAGVIIRENQRFNGIELVFTTPPSESIKAAIKAMGYRWSNKGLWYVKNTPNTLSRTNALFAGPAPSTRQSTTEQAKAKLKLLMLTLQPLST